MARVPTAKQFDALSAKWDANHGPASMRGKEFSARIRYLCGRCRGMGKPRVLDLGCGTGQVLLHLATEIADGIGVDISPGMVSRAQKAATGTNLQFVMADAIEFCMSWPDVFDLVLFVGSIEHFPDQDAMIGATKRVLADNGRLITISPHPWNPSYLARHTFEIGKVPRTRHMSPLRLERAASRHGYKLSGLCSLPYAPWLPLVGLHIHPSRDIRPVYRRSHLCGVLSGAYGAELSRGRNEQ